MRGPTAAWTVVYETFRALILASSMTVTEKQKLLDAIDAFHQLEECEIP